MYIGSFVALTPANVLYSALREPCSNGQEDVHIAIASGNHEPRDRVEIVRQRQDAWVALIPRVQSEAISR